MNSLLATSEGYPRRNRREIETDATKLAKRFQSIGALKDARIPIERYLQEMADASIESMWNLRSHGAEAVVCRNRSPEGRKFTVLVDQAIAEGPIDSYRMALGEEFGHLCIHQPLVASVMTVESFCELHRRGDWHEIEFDALGCGRTVLMPEPLLTSVAAQCYCNAVSDEGFCNLNNTMAAWIRGIARAFGVPVPDVRARLGGTLTNLLERFVQSFASRKLRLVPLNLQQETTTLESCDSRRLIPSAEKNKAAMQQLDLFR